MHITAVLGGPQLVGAPVVIFVCVASCVPVPRAKTSLLRKVVILVPDGWRTAVRGRRVKQWSSLRRGGR